MDEEDAVPAADRARLPTAAFLAGGPRSFDAFRDVVQLLLGATVLADGQFVRLAGRGGRRGDDVRVLAGTAGPTDPLLLRDGRWLRLGVTLFLDRVGPDRARLVEAGVRSSVDDFGVPTAKADWRPILSASEATLAGTVLAVARG